MLKDGKPVTVSCAEGDTGFVYRGVLEVEVIDHAGQVIQASAIGPLNDVILLAGPSELDLSANLIVDDQLSLAGHFESYDTGSPFGLK